MNPVMTQAYLPYTVQSHPASVQKQSSSVSGSACSRAQHRRGHQYNACPHHLKVRDLPSIMVFGGYASPLFCILNETLCCSGWKRLVDLTRCTAADAHACCAPRQVQKLCANIAQCARVMWRRAYCNHITAACWS